jgi:hypothetical protein
LHRTEWSSSHESSARRVSARTNGNGSDPATNSAASPTCSSSSKAGASRTYERARSTGSAISRAVADASGSVNTPPNRARPPLPQGKRCGEGRHLQPYPNPRRRPNSCARCDRHWHPVEPTSRPRCPTLRATDRSPALGGRSVSRIVKDHVDSACSRIRSRSRILRGQDGCARSLLARTSCGGGK